jgi:hypothetical protein
MKDFLDWFVGRTASNALYEVCQLPDKTPMLKY